MLWRASSKSQVMSSLQLFDVRTTLAKKKGEKRLLCVSDRLISVLVGRNPPKFPYRLTPKSLFTLWFSLSGISFF